MMMSTNSWRAAFPSPLVSFCFGLHSISITHVSHGQKAPALKGVVFTTKLPFFFLSNPKCSCLCRNFFSPLLPSSFRTFYPPCPARILAGCCHTCIFPPHFLDTDKSERRKDAARRYLLRTGSFPCPCSLSMAPGGFFDPLLLLCLLVTTFLCIWLLLILRDRGGRSARLSLPFVTLSLIF